MARPRQKGVRRGDTWTGVRETQGAELSLQLHGVTSLVRVLSVPLIDLDIQLRPTPRPAHRRQVRLLILLMVGLVLGLSGEGAPITPLSSDDRTTLCPLVTIAATLVRAEPDQASSVRVAVVDDTGRVMRIVYCPA